MSISTLRGMLEVMFDVLEGSLIFIVNFLGAYTFTVLRYLRFNHQVLHRDISKGNMLYLEEVARLLDGEEVPVCFIKYLLKESYVRIVWEFGLLT